MPNNGYSPKDWSIEVTLIKGCGMDRTLARRAFLISVFINIYILLSATTGYAGFGDASRQLRVVMDGVMDIQARPDLKGNAHHKQRARLIMRLISENFLIDDMEEKSLDGYWNKISRTQRTEFQQLFTTLFEDSYSGMVLDFMHKASIEYGSESRTSGGVVVATLIRTVDESIPVNYAMVQKRRSLVYSGRRD